MPNFKKIHLLAGLIILSLGGIQEAHAQIAEKQDNDKWTDFYNLKADSLQDLYDQKAIKIRPDGKMLEGRAQIAEFIFSNSQKLLSIESDTLILANKGRAIAYEISENLYENDESYKNLVIWQTKNSGRKRVFEFTAKMEESPINLQELDDRRAQWIRLCNEHDAKKLIYELYSKNTLYYNHKPIIKGRADLVGEYQYMNNPQYSLSLQPIIVSPVNEDFIFEIGQCSGSYGGKYILIWRKDLDGKWRIFIDSNI